MDSDKRISRDQFGVTLRVSWSDKAYVLFIVVILLLLCAYCLVISFEQSNLGAIVRGIIIAIIILFIGYHLVRRMPLKLVCKPGNGIIQTADLFGSRQINLDEVTSAKRVFVRPKQFAAPDTALKLKSRSGKSLFILPATLPGSSARGEVGAILRAHNIVSRKTFWSRYNHWDHNSLGID